MNRISPLHNTAHQSDGDMMVCGFFSEKLLR